MKKLLSVLLAIVMVMSFAACGNDKDKDPVDEDDTNIVDTVDDNADKTGDAEDADKTDDAEDTDEADYTDDVDNADDADNADEDEEETK